MTDAAILETPLHALHVELGARMAPFADYDMPIHYPMGVLAEHLHTRSRAGLFDVSHMGQARLRGASHEVVARFLETLCPADLLGLAPGRQRYTQLLNPSGGVVDDLMVARAPDADGELRLVVNASRKAVDFALIGEALPEGVTLSRLDDLALIAVQGPEAARILAPLAPGAGLEAMAFMSVGPASIGGVDAFVSRSGYTGEDGYEISLPAVKAEAFARLLLACSGMAPIGLGARRFAAPRSGLVPLRARTRRDRRSGRGGARLVDPEAPAHRGRLSGRGASDSGRWPKARSV